MLIAIITILILVGVTYRKDVTTKPIPGKPVWYPYRRIIGLLALTLVPILLINSFMPNRIVATSEEKIELGKENNNVSLISEGYRELAQRYPDSLELQFRHIDYLVRYHKLSHNQISIDSTKVKKETLVLLRTYVEIVSDAPSIRLSRLNAIPYDYPFANYIRALAYRAFNPLDFKRTDYHLKRETNNHPNCQRAWEFRWTLYLTDHDKELAALMHNEHAIPFVPEGFRNDYYFRHGEYDRYAATIIESRFYDVTLITLISAFFVSFVWILFLRSMDVFNREKWWHIGLVFVAGGVFTLFCLPIYDYADVVLNFHINGDPFNDFMYCFLIIGGGEELVKLLPWVLFAIFSRRFQEPFDYILYASVTALGFAFTENLMYLEDTGSIVSRSILSTVAHMFDASVVAYAVILSKYKFKQRFWKLATPVIGFILAALCHGFYDYWLISPAAEGYYYITLLFFLLSLHVWFFFKNNAMNNSGFFGNAGAFNVAFQQDLLTFSMLGLLILEYVFVSFEFGALEGNEVIGRRAIIVVVFVIYLSFILRKLKLKKGVWQKYRFRIPNIVPRFLSWGTPEEEEEHDFIGLKLRLFAPKTNRYIGDKLPKSGVCVSRITVNDDPNWYVFQLNTPIHYSNFVPTHIIIRNKQSGQLLDQPKIEIYFMFIPDIRLLERTHLQISELRYAGRAYSMPID